MKFRFDVGFLRAFAVLIVVLFHFEIPFFAGGFIGVDIFFVISGFLMTAIILKGFSNDSFTLRDFYIRRFNRIVPALFVMMLLVLLITFFLFFPIDFKLVSIYTFFSGIFASNYYYLFNSGYFDPSSQSNILLHTWSLSVEWQFYMIYPLLLLCLKRYYFKKRYLFNVVFISILVFSFLLVVAFNEFLPSAFSKVSFFSFTHRAWEMMFGGLAFLYGDFFETKLSNISKRFLSLFCLMTLILGVLYLTDDNIWPSYLTMIPVFASFLIIALNTDFSFYRSSIVQRIGNLSYSWYLWHWPSYVIVRYFDIGGLEITISLIFLSLFWAYLSYVYIEKQTKRFSFKLVTLVSLSVLLISFVFSTTSSNSALFSNEAILLSEFKHEYDQTRRIQFNSGVCHNVGRINYVDCLCIDSSKENILLLGDSHAGQFSFSFRNRLDSVKYNFLEHTVVGAFPLLNSSGEPNATNQFRQLLTDFIPENRHRIDYIIISCNWLNYPSNSGFKSIGDLAEAINSTIHSFEKLGIKVLIIGQSEVYNIDYPRIEAFRITRPRSYSNANNDSYVLNKELKFLVPLENYVDIYLNEEVEHFNFLSMIPYMFDGNHRTIYGADQTVNYIIRDHIN